MEKQNITKIESALTENITPERIIRFLMTKRKITGYTFKVIQDAPTEYKIRSEKKKIRFCSADEMIAVNM